MKDRFARLGLSLELRLPSVPCTGAVLQMLGPGHPDHLELEERLRDIIEEIN